MIDFFIKKTKAILAILLLAPIMSWSQGISGKVENEKGEAVDFASVLLLADSSTVVAKTFTDERGGFVLDSVAAGSYMLRVSPLSGNSVYVPSFSYTGGALKLPAILVSQVTMLEDVTVSADRQTIELQADKKVFNVSQSLMQEAGTAEDMLRQVPTVQVDNDGGVSLRGNSNVLILIDGKQSAMFGSENADIIQQLPAGSIEKIEVMTNPSSKYDAQGMGGVINFVLKKTNSNTKQGSLTLGAGTGDRYNASLNYNVSKGNTKLGFNLNARNMNRDDFFKTTRTIPQPYTSIYTEGDHQKRRSRSFANVTMEQTLKNKDILTVGLQGSYNYIANLEKNTADYLSSDGSVDSSIYREMPFDVNPHGIGVELGYTHHFTENQKLQFSNSFNRYRADRHQDFETRKTDAQGNIIGVDTLQTLSGDGGRLNNVAQLDYSNDINDKYTLEAGAKYQYNTFSSSNAATKKFADDEVYDSLLTNSFSYHENFYAAYASMRMSLSDKWEAQAGLRYEDFAYLGEAASVEDEIEVTYRNLFPTVYLSYRASDKSSWQWNYSRRVNRPRFWHLFPYVNVSDPLNTRIGNPALQPEFINISELSYEYKIPNHQLISTAYVQYTTDLIQRIYTFNTDGSSVLVPYNLNSSITYGIELTHVWTWNKLGDWTLNFNGFNTQIDGDNLGGDIGNSGASWFLKSLANFNLYKNLKLQWTANYLASAAISQGKREPQWYTDLGFRYSILSNKFVFTLNANDIFNSYRTVTVLDTEELYQRIDRKPNSQFVQLSVTWNFINTAKGSGGQRKKGRGGIQDRNSNFDPGGDSGGEG